MSEREGQCLCGAVRFSVDAALTDVGVCHCGMCRRWVSGPFHGLHVRGPVAFKGAEHITVYRGSPWAERGFCARCGSPVFWRMHDQSETVLPVGAFADVAGFNVGIEVFTDEKPDYYDYTEGSTRMTAAEVMAHFGAAPTKDAPQ